MTYYCPGLSLWGREYLPCQRQTKSRTGGKMGTFSQKQRHLTTHIHTSACTYIYMYKYACVYLNTYTYVYACVHVNIHVYICTHIYTHMCLVCIYSIQSRAYCFLFFLVLFFVFLCFFFFNPFAAPCPQQLLQDVSGQSRVMPLYIQHYSRMA